MTIFLTWNILKYYRLVKIMNFDVYAALPFSKYNFIKEFSNIGQNTHVSWHQHCDKDSKPSNLCKILVFQGVFFFFSFQLHRWLEYACPVLLLFGLSNLLTGRNNQKYCSVFVVRIYFRDFLGFSRARMPSEKVDPQKAVRI